MKVLIVQTAFLGDVILMTAMVESLVAYLPDSEIHVLVRKEHGVILANHPHIKKVHFLEKGKRKYQNLRKMVRDVRSEHFNMVFNCHRFASSGYLTARSGAGVRIGFDKSPMAFSYTVRVKHRYEQGLHELERNHQLLQAHWQDIPLIKPRLYPHKHDYRSVRSFKQATYYVVAPASVWFTKEYPIAGWLDVIQPLDAPVYVIGGPGDKDLGMQLELQGGKKVTNLAGSLSLLESVALIDGATAVFANDSAPTHMGTAMNTPTHTMFCSTDTSFGFGPRADVAFVHEDKTNLSCRPCGIHGKKKCPEGHFLCSKFKVNPIL